MPPLPPLVTVLIPAYNAGKTITATIESILKQDYPNAEIIVCDNLSTDNTAEIVRQYEKKGIRYYLNSTPGTAEQNWNYALDLPTSDFIALYHADDLYSSSILSQQVKFLTDHPEICSVFTMSSLINEEGKPLATKNKTITTIPDCNEDNKIFDFNTLLNAVLKHSNFIKTPTLLTRKETQGSIGKFNLAFKSSADLDMWLRMAKYRSIGIINQSLHQYRISSSQGSSVIFNKILELPDYFRVAESYVKENKSLIKKESLAYYEMIKGGELILCSLNLLNDGQNKKAKINLREALTIQNISRALSRKRLFIRYMIGSLLLLASYVGLGKASAKVIQFAYNGNKKKWNKPL